MSDRCLDLSKTLPPLCDHLVCVCVKAIRSDGTGAFIVTFKTAEQAKSAYPTLDALKLENDGAVNSSLLPCYFVSAAQQMS